jgi:hypothetical protein
MHSRPAVRILLASSLCAACGPVVATGDEGSTGAAESSSTSGSSTIDPGSGSTGSSESGAAQTSDSGDPPPDDVPGVDPEPCPDSQWPDDGSEVLEHVTESAVVDWTETGFSALYSTYLSDDSPVPGQQTLGLSGNPPDATAYNFGATIDMMSAVELRGRRIRMRAPVALSSVEVRANLWLRIDVTTGESANLDNGSDQPAYGTSEAWQSQEIVVDVPDDAETIVFGSLLSGPGTILVSNPVFDIVSEDVPTTAPNRRRPDVALSCAAPTDAYVEEIVHYTRADQWGPSNGPVAGQEFGRDDDVTYDGVPSLHVSGESSSSYAGFFAWAGQMAGRRLRLTLPLRAMGFTGEARLVFRTMQGEQEVARATAPLPLEDGADWVTYTVVAEVPDAAHVVGIAGVELDGVGDVWVGFGVIEAVTDEVPLSPLAE